MENHCISEQSRYISLYWAGVNRTVAAVSTWFVRISIQQLKKEERREKDDKEGQRGILSGSAVIIRSSVTCAFNVHDL